MEDQLMPAGIQVYDVSGNTVLDEKLSSASFVCSVSNAFWSRFNHIESLAIDRDNYRGSIFNIHDYYGWDYNTRGVFKTNHPKCFVMKNILNYYGTNSTHQIVHIVNDGSVSASRLDEVLHPHTSYQYDFDLVRVYQNEMRVIR